MKFEVDTEVLRRVMDEIRFIIPQIHKGITAFKIQDDGVLDIRLFVEILRGMYPAITLIDTARMPHMSSRITGSFFSRYYWTVDVRVDTVLYKAMFDSYYGEK